MIGNVLRVRYELTQLLSEGPIFTSYAARDRLQGREICVRLLRDPYASDETLLNRIREVVAAYAVIEHPAVEVLTEVDEDDGATFLISELSKGVPLAERIRKLAPFSVPVAVSTAISLCEGLEALHSAGMAHGDVSGLNVMSLPDGQVRLQLPGMWQAYAANSTAAMTMLPHMSPFLAPEVSAGALPSPASDVYSAGVLLYELLTGRLPYNADTPVSMALKHATGTVPSVRMYNPSVPAVLDEIVKKALAKEPGRRYASAGALLTDLRVLQDALRFGRTVTWPITPEAPPTIDTMPKKTAPKAEASRNAPKPRDKRESSDVPLFLWILIAIFGAAAATMLGIWFFFNLSKPTLVKVPNLAGLSQAEAREMVKFSKLQLQVSGYRSSEKVPAEYIISTEPAAGESVREGGHVRIVLSSGSQLVAVPNLKGNSLDQARAILQGAHLELDDNILTTRSKTVEAGLIVSQTPAAGKKVDQTSKVRVTVSSGDGGQGETNLYTLKVTLSKITQPVTLRVDIEDDRGTTTFYESVHEPEETVELVTRGTGKQVTFKIYYDNELVRTVTQDADDATPLNEEPNL